MRRLIRLLTGRRADGERGAIAVLTAFLVMFVAVGMLALTVDLGNITYNRSQLQNGADASSLALAAACAQSSTADPQCEVTDTLRALAVKNANATDQSMSILTNGKTCVGSAYNGTTSLPTCPAPADEDTTSLTKCQSWPLNLSPSSLPYVEVTTQTKMKDGSTVLPFHFAQILSGQGNGSTSETCARAAWGTVSKAPVKAPITISACQWKEETNDGANYVSTGPAYNRGGPGGGDYGYGDGETPWPTPDREIVLTLHDPTDTQSNCDWNGKQTAGGFGYIGDKDNPCSANVVDGWAHINTGADKPPCDFIGHVFEIPIFDCIISSKTPPTGPPPSTPDDVCAPTKKDSSGFNSYYHIAGYGKFYVSGVYLTGGDPGSVMPNGHASCGGSGKSGRCLMGWFLQGTIDDSITIVPPGGGNDFGIYAVLPAG
ncbi:hypothetical protein GCM10011492_38080 [Flexivirga endophytica]|uniref:Putative Flp pilus-assembly TadG-like N-terminal domain-containing protein n=1 Tax=Flexivirga endophytica TaxID=1849103 RepID=A0A916THM7_9MICO|nr:pilus assembly protein TadG-related protein [Flexivirga endophytica]GGB43474.1 hypothetical protein GCM10011492_38080 [Flexivirga endophytica]GHB68379.1 hypothetical protein GCM10008112_41430 [Flexivirga endophytica]